MMSERVRTLLKKARRTHADCNVSIWQRCVVCQEIDEVLATPSHALEWTDHPESVDATAFDQQTGSGVTIAPEMKGFRWYIKSPGTPVISSAWFDTMDEAKLSAQMMIDAFRNGVHRGE